MPVSHSRLLLAVSALLFSGIATLGAEPSPANGTRVLTVDEAVRIALANNLPLRSAARDITKAHDEAASARAALLPVIQVKAETGLLLEPVDIRVPAGSLGVVNQAPFPTSDALLYSAHGGIGLIGATIAQPLTQLPRIRLNIHLQQVGIQAAQERQRGRQLALIAAVKQTYYEILETQAGITAAQASLAYDQELTRTVADLVARETTLEADLLDAQAQTAKQELAVSALHDTLADAQERMNVFLGRDIDTPFAVTMPAADPRPLDDPQALAQRALRQRPDLQEARLRREQAATGLRIAQEPNLPAISLALSFHQLAGHIDGLPDSVSFLGLQFDWTPIDWGRQRNARDLQAQQNAQAEEALQDAQSQVLLDISSRVRAYRRATDRLSVAQAGRQAAQERLREMTNQYKAKTILLPDLLRQQAAAADADGQEQQATVQLLAARAALETAVGGDAQ